MNEHERLRYIREKTGLSVSKFAESIGAKDYKVRDIEQGKQKITPEIALSIEEKYLMRLKWILFGTGSMYEPPPSNINNTIDQNEAYEVDMLSVRVGAGTGIYNYEVSVIDKIILDKVFFRTEPDLSKIKVVEVDGDSMEPTIKHGDYVVIDESKREKSNGIYALQLDGQLLIKRLQFKLDGTVLIISDNDKYETEIYDPNNSQLACNIMGKKLLTIQR